MKEIEPDSDFSEQKYLNITKDDVMDESSSLKNINNIINKEKIKEYKKEDNKKREDDSRWKTLFSYKNYPLIIIGPGCKCFFTK